jgi:hypothetical protein
MQKRYLNYAAAIASVLVLTYCSSGSVNNASTGLLPVPGISSAVTFSFDLGAVDPVTHIYYVTDRTNKAVDVFNPAAPLVTQFKNSSYAGCNSGGTSGGATKFPYIPMPGCLNIAITANNTLVTNNDLDGPDGLDIVGPNLFVGDVNALWVVNKTTGAIVVKIATPNTGTQQGFRSDEGCYDPLNHLYASALTGDPNTPFYTILDTTAHDADLTGATAPVVIAQLLMNDSTGAASGGLEACFFDTRGVAAGAGYMWLNNDGSTANPHGEADGIPIADLLALKAVGFPRKVVFAGPLTATPDFNAGTTSAPACALGGGGACGAVPVKIFALPALCDPTGITAGPAAGNEVGAMCRPGTFGTRMDFVVFNTGVGAAAPSLVTAVAGAGGGDQIAYDPVSNRYYLANNRATPSGKSCFSGGTQACNLTPKLTVVDGTSHLVVANFDSGNNSHSVAVDGARGIVYSPFTNTSATAGGANFPGGGIAMFNTF